MTQGNLPARVDVAVVGLGAAGSAALSVLARAGVKTLGIDRYAPPHAWGSSHGETRMLRTAYSEGAAYVPMVHRAIGHWRDLEARTGTALFRQSGVTYFGPQSLPFLTSAKAAAAQWNVALAPIARSEIASALAIPEHWEGLLDVAGGHLDAEASILAFLGDARSYGARAAENCRCLSLDFREDAATIETSLGSVRADRVIVTTGAWANELVPALQAVTYVERRVLHWFEVTDGLCTAASGFRPFLITTEDGAALYGIPSRAKGEVKIAEHFVHEPIASPEALDRTASAKDLDLIRPLVSRFLPRLGRPIRSAVCMYPMSRDEHFIVDRHPDHARLIIGAGLSGHGFKFAPVIGEALANMAMDKPQEIDAEFFSLSRFAEFR